MSATTSPQLQHSSKPTFVPHPYQERAIQMMLTQALVALFLDPGLGKTAVALSAFKLLKSQQYVKRLLVIAPLRPCYAVWPAELEKWANFTGLTYVVLHGDEKLRRLGKNVDIVITNVDTIRWLADDGRFKKIGADVLVVDESTEFKHTNTAKFKSLKPFLNLFKRRWILTGTPAPNGLMDLFGQIYLLDQGAALGRFVTHFRYKYFTPLHFNSHEWRPLPTAEADISELIAPYVLRLRAEDYLKMPELHKVRIPVILPEHAQKSYRKVEQEFFLALQGKQVMAANAAAAGVKCRQIANGAVYDVRHDVLDVHGAKLDAFEELVEELSGQPVLVLYEFIHDYERLHARIPGWKLGGGQAPAQEQAIIDAFNEGKIPVLYGHPASMGHGLNLQGACRHIIFFGITWDLELYEQSIRRIYRQGQRAESVMVYHLVAKGTLDETVLGVLFAKDRTQQSLLNAVTAQALPGEGERAREAGFDTAAI